MNRESEPTMTKKISELTTQAAELASLVGQSGLLSTERGLLRMRVKIMDVKRSFARVDVLVKPEAGEDETWVSVDRVQLDGAGGAK